MTRSPALAAWHRIAEARDPAGLADLLAEDVVFQSPVVHAPQRGKAITLKYLTAALESLGAAPDFRYVGEWHAEGSAVLNFLATIGGIEIDGVDIITWNAEDKITGFKVMVRPAKGLQAVQAAMAARLER